MAAVSYVIGINKYSFNSLLRLGRGNRRDSDARSGAPDLFMCSGSRISGKQRLGSGNIYGCPPISH
jgi:hypothetical protein